MITAMLLAVGLSLGSFVNALVWRVHEQETEAGKKKPNRKYLRELSITKGRSMCPMCHHELRIIDLIPVYSWLRQGGKCRYCHKPISAQYPLVELLTAGLFGLSYAFWPVAISRVEVLSFGLWLVLLTGLVALLVYDLKWLLLPNRIMYPLAGVAGLLAAVELVTADGPLSALFNVILAVAIGGGIFYGLFQVSNGKWIGGGDVKLGWLLGLVVATPARAVLVIFSAAALGSLVSLPLLASKRLQRNSVIPFGPFLIIGAIITVLWGSDILDWYQDTFINL